MEDTTTPQYEAPALVELGSVSELTLAAKVLRRTDGFTFNNASIGQITDPRTSL